MKETAGPHVNVVPTLRDLLARADRAHAWHAAVGVLPTEDDAFVLVKCSCGEAVAIGDKVAEAFGLKIERVRKLFMGRVGLVPVA